MSEFRTIEIDFDVHKITENARTSFSESTNDVLRRLLNLPPRGTPAPSKQGANGQHRSWSGEGVTLLHGTELRMRYNGRLYEGKIVDGKWAIEGKTFDSPSGAASGIAVTKRGKRTRLDGWVYWEVKRPGDDTWIRVVTLRPDYLRVSDLTPEQLGL